MIKKDYYEVLGIARDADFAEVKKAYRQKAMQYHPDKNQGDREAEERFKEASEAYEVLSDSNKRQIYDSYGHQGLENTGFTGFSGAEDIFSSFGDLFEDFFGGFADFGFGRRGSSRPRRGGDLRHDVTVTFEEAAFGIKKDIRVEKEVRCDMCGGEGIEAGSKRAVCHSCGGSGRISHRQGFFMMQSGCARCGGTGSVVDHPCKGCRGSGMVRKEKKLTVSVPAGVEDGMHLVLRGEGEIGSNSGPPGDMYVVVAVQPHKFFVRHGRDIYYKLEVGFPEAALGVEVDVPTLYGNARIAVPAGTQTGDLLQMKGSGVPDVRSGKKGNQIIEVHVLTPKKLTRRQKELLQEFIREGK